MVIEIVKCTSCPRHVNKPSAWFDEFGFFYCEEHAPDGAQPVENRNAVDDDDEGEEEMKGDTDLPESFTCPYCGATSYNLEDIRNKYCSNCHSFIKE